MMQKNAKGLYPPHIMPEPLSFQKIKVPDLIQSVLPHDCRYNAGHLVSDLLSMFEGKSAQGRLHQIVEAWQGNALINEGYPARAKHQAVEYFRFFRRFPNSQLFRDISEYAGNDPCTATEIFLQILASTCEASGASGQGSGLGMALSRLSMADGITIPFVPSRGGSMGAGKGHPGLVARAFRVSELLKTLKLEYSFASKKSYETHEVPYPDEEIGYHNMRSFSEIHKIAPHQFYLPDEVFYPRLAKKELHVIRFFEKIYKPRHFVMLLDVSGSMEEKLSNGYSRAEYAIASAIALLQNALKGANNASIHLFDDQPYDKIEGTIAEVIEVLLQCPFSGGGTSIDRALEFADEQSPDEIILITDGDDSVRYKPAHPLTVYQCGGEENEGLKKIAKAYKEVI